MGNSDRYRPKRQRSPQSSTDSSHSSRSRHRSKRSRQRSTDSTSNTSSKRHRSDDRSKAGKRMGSIQEEEDSPPSYDLSQSRDASAIGTTSDSTSAATVGEILTRKKAMTVESRVAWSCALGVPLFAAVLLLFLVTASSTTLRVDFSVIKIKVSSPTVDALFGVMKKYEGGSSGEGTGGSVLESMAGTVGMDKRAGEGFMTLGIWGWCVATKDYTKTACSPSSGWYNLEESLGGNAGDIPGDAFNTFLVHMLVLHGLTLLAAMLATVPVGLYIWKRYYNNDDQVEGGWFQHGTVLAGTILGIMAWVFDKFLMKSIKKKIPPDTVSYGPAATLAGTAALLLLVSFFTSTLPVFGRFARFKMHYASRWRNVEDALETEREKAEAVNTQEEAGAGPVKRRKKGRSKKAWRNRMTRMLY